MEACVTVGELWGFYSYVLIREFQNRKRYGGMRDRSNIAGCISNGANTSFKTVNGMEACVTGTFKRAIYGKNETEFQNRKRYGGIRD